jgi:basic amino acid/polyamine antiporter, APA family
MGTFPGHSGEAAAVLCVGVTNQLGSGRCDSPHDRARARLTPTFSLVLTSALVSILILMFYQQSMVKVFTFMTLLSTTACLVLYALCSLALLRLHWGAGRALRRRRTLAIAVVAVLATVYSVWAIIGAGLETMAWGAALLAVGAPVYWLSLRKVTI